MNNRNLNIDLTKSIACLAILGLHCIGYTNYTLYYICTFGVPVFFMVNGYLMFGKSAVSFKYTLTKVLSVVRIVVLWNLIIMIPVMVLKHKFANPFVQIYKSLIQQGYLWHFWFFGTLIILYLILYPLHKLLSNPKFGLKLHIILLIVLFITCIGNTIYSYCNHYAMCVFVPQSLRLWVSLFYYLTGGLIARLNKTDLIKKIPASVLAVSVIFLGVICNYGQKHLGNFGYSLRAAEYFYDELTVILWCVSIFVFISRIRIPSKYEKLIASASKLSLGVFIIHPLILKVSEVVLIAKTTPQAIALWGAVTVISVITSFVISKIPFVRKLIEL